MSQADSRYQQLRTHLAYLKLTAAAEALPGHLDQAMKMKATHTEFLEQLVAVEVTAVEARRHAGLLRFANFPAPWRLDDFDFTAQPSVDPALLRELVAAGGDPSTVHGVASFLVSHVDSKSTHASRASAEPMHCVDVPASSSKTRLPPVPLPLRWRPLGPVVRPWSTPSSSAVGINLDKESPANPDTLYVDSLIGPDTVTTLPWDTIGHLEVHGTLARTVDVDMDAAEETMRLLDAVDIDMDAVGVTLQDQGLAALHTSFQQVLRP